MSLGMLIPGMRQGSDHGPLVAALGKHGQVFANLDSRCLGSNRFELATDFLWRIGFRVETIVLCQTARQENVNDRLGRRWRAGVSGQAAQALDVIQRLLADEAVEQRSSGLSKREWDELMGAVVRDP